MTGSFLREQSKLNRTRFAMSHRLTTMSHRLTRTRQQDYFPALVPQWHGHACCSTNGPLILIIRASHRHITFPRHSSHIWGIPGARFFLTSGTVLELSCVDAFIEELWQIDLPFPSRGGLARLVLFEQLLQSLGYVCDASFRSPIKEAANTSLPINQDKHRAVHN